MIHYQLCCDEDHAFDGWFRDSAAFDGQAKQGLVACPHCGSGKVRRALMAPSIGRTRGAAVDEPAVAGGAAGVAPSPALPTSPGGMPDVAASPVMAAAMPDKVRAMLQRLRAEVETKCEHVGDRFAAEARAIHRGEADARGIYGEATPEQAEALADEGIEVARLPWVPRSDA